MNQMRETNLSVDRMINEGLGGGQIYYNCDATKFRPVIWDFKNREDGISYEHNDAIND